MYFATSVLTLGLLWRAVDATASQAYTWKNVRIGGKLLITVLEGSYLPYLTIWNIGGGGFVPGIVFNPGAKGLAYARTDIGGVYKLNADDSWTPLTDWVNNTNW